MTDREDVLRLLRDRFDALDQRMDSQDETLRDMLAEAKKTNSRVTKLEIHREKRARVWRFVLKSAGAIVVSSCAGVGLELTKLIH